MINIKAIIGFSVLVLIFAVLFVSVPTAEEARIYDSIVRLHVIAASDSEEDQRIKLLVRDAALGVVGEAVTDCGDRAEAEKKIGESMNVILLAARKVLEGEGCDSSVKITLTSEHYPVRGYDGYTLPAGVYRSLRIIIGEGEGHNWWCVLFPQLCTGAALEKKAAVEAGFTGDQIRILTEGDEPKYIVKFKFLEIISEMIGGEN